MSLSKVKAKKQKTRLKLRIAAYEKLADNKGHTKPGSNRK